MIGQDHPDLFEVLNGPEDGADFPLTQPRADLGSDPACAVLLRLDHDIRPRHARVTVVSEGYRIRSLERPGVLVDGRRAGLIRSRVARHGSVLRVGATELALVCAPDGLAGRSRGLPRESDLGWALRVGALHGANALYAVSRGLRRLLGKLMMPLVLLALALILTAVFLPGLFAWIRDWAVYLFQWASYGLGRMLP